MFGIGLLGEVTPVPRTSPDGLPAPISYADEGFPGRPGNAAAPTSGGASRCRCSLTWRSLFSSPIPHQLPKEVKVEMPDCVLSRCEVHELISRLPPRYYEAPWVLLFDTEHDGNSLAQFYRKLTDFEASHQGEQGCAAIGLLSVAPRRSKAPPHAPTVAGTHNIESPLDRSPSYLGVGQHKEVVVGAFTPEMPSHFHTGSHCFGSKETSVFGFHAPDADLAASPSLHFYKWAGVNEEFLVCSPEFLGVGGGSNGAALFVDSEIQFGTTAGLCTTFGSPALTGTDWGRSEGLGHQEFEVKRMQWFALDTHSVRTSTTSSEEAPPLCCSKPGTLHQCVL